jgi:hypothetical protein
MSTLSTSLLRPFEADNSCPCCGASGRLVKRVTLESLLRSDALARLGAADYYFCPSERCDVVYFSERGEAIFPKADLKVRVGIKETDAPRRLCYCFDHAMEDIEEEIRLTGKSTVLESIKTRIKKACWCETKSPLGTCCLGTVARYVKAAQDRNTDARSQSTAKDSLEGLPSGAARRESQFASLRKMTAGKVQVFSMLGSVVSAWIASACCWLPLLLAAGVSGVTIGNFLEHYRIDFQVLAIALLGIGFFFAYQPRLNTTVSVTEREPGESCCESGRLCCAPS